MKKIAFLAFLAIGLGACSSNSDEPQPDANYNIIGVWHEYAYKCSDGYFTESLGSMDFTTFNSDGTYTETSNLSGTQYTNIEGTFLYDNATHTAKVTTKNGLTFDIVATFVDNDNATFERLPTSPIAKKTVKVKRNK